MSSKPKKSKRPSWIEAYRSIRKAPVPSGRVIQPKDRDAAKEDEREIAKWEIWRGEDYEDFEE